jgi:hypothetical protein
MLEELELLDLVGKMINGPKELVTEDSKERLLLHWVQRHADAIADENNGWVDDDELDRRIKADLMRHPILAVLIEDVCDR